MSANLIRKFSSQVSASGFKNLMNLWPPYRAAGIKLDYIGRDFRSLHVSMTLHWYNQNYVGTHFGGSLYAMTDPFYMLMLMHNLGRDYIVWDQAASIRFRKADKGKVSALFQLTETELEEIKQSVEKQGKTLFKKQVLIINRNLEIVAEVDKVIYVRKKTRDQAPFLARGRINSGC